MSSRFSIPPSVASASVVASVLAAPTAARWGVLVCVFLVIIGSCLYWRRGRLIVMVIPAFAVALIGIYRIEKDTRLPTVSLASSDAVVITGRLQQDLRPGASDVQNVTVQLVHLTDKRGWRGSAVGRVRLFWRGDGTVICSDRRGRETPMKGDCITATVEHESLLSGVAWISGDEPELDIRTGTIAAARRNLRRAVERRFTRLRPQTAGLVTALILGDRGSLSPELTDSIRRAGGAHVLALSGMHLGILAVIVRKSMGLFLSRTPATLVTTFVLTSYCWLTGWIPSLVRALVLIYIIVLSMLHGRRYPSYILLARTVVVVAVITPGLIADLGFQYSILALLGLFLLYPRVCAYLQWVMPRPIAAYLAASLAAILSTAPLSFAYFGVLYPAGVLLAGVLSCIVAAIMWTGLAFALVAYVPLLGTRVMALLDLFVHLFYRLGAAGADIPGVYIPSVSLVVSIGILAGSVGGVLLLRQRSRHLFEAQKESYGESRFDY